MPVRYCSAPRLDGRTLTDVAAALWDHAPRMKTPPAHFDAE